MKLSFTTQNNYEISFKKNCVLYSFLILKLFSNFNSNNVWASTSRLKFKNNASNSNNQYDKITLL